MAGAAKERQVGMTTATPETGPRRRLAVATAVLLALALAGCGGPPPTSPVPPGATPPAAATVPLEQLTDRPLGYAEQRLGDAADRLDPAAGYPRATGPDGHWQLGDADNWTSGFFAGTLWLLYEHTHDPVWRGRAERWTAGLESQATRTDTHDLGFMIFNSFGQEYLLTGAPRAREVAVTAARSVATRYNPAVGAIKSWDVDASMPATWQFPVIIDNMMNLELLYWGAGQPGGDPAWAELATHHALTTATANLRPDGSTAHVALFDPSTGAFLGQDTWQGQSPSSTWSRGQAWAIHGFTDAYRLSPRPELLDAAQRTADWFLAHLPADLVPYWDFDAAGIPNTERDASSAAIAAAGLVELGRLTGGPRGYGYRSAAERIVGSLSANYLTSDGNEAVLAHSVGFHREHSEVDVSIVYADYYFLEALLRLRRE
jgi:unsaturated chondroitin disaccharide hydrolase